MSFGLEITHRFVRQEEPWISFQFYVFIYCTPLGILHLVPRELYHNPTDFVSPFICLPKQCPVVMPYHEGNIIFIRSLYVCPSYVGCKHALLAGFLRYIPAIGTPLGPPFHRDHVTSIPASQLHAGISRLPNPPPPAATWCPSGSSMESSSGGASSATATPR